MGGFRFSGLPDAARDKLISRAKRRAGPATVSQLFPANEPGNKVGRGAATRPVWCPCFARSCPVLPGLARSCPVLLALH